MNLEETREMAMRAMKSAISRDSLSGNGVDFLILTKDGIVEESLSF
jgi:20S proteasome alpha/beta subunit